MLLFRSLRLLLWLWMSFVDRSMILDDDGVFLLSCTIVVVSGGWKAHVVVDNRSSAIRSITLGIRTVSFRWFIMSS